jgi:hypothetical protein
VGRRTLPPGRGGTGDGGRLAHRLDAAAGSQPRSAEERCSSAVEALWRWLREDVTYHHCHAGLDDLIRRVAAFQARINQEPYALANRLRGKDHLDPEEEKLRFSS